MASPLAYEFSVNLRRATFRIDSFSIKTVNDYYRMIELYTPLAATL